MSAHTTRLLDALRDIITACCCGCEGYDSEELVCFPEDGCTMHEAVANGLSCIKDWEKRGDGHTVKVDPDKLKDHAKRVCRHNLKANKGKGCKCCQKCPFIDAVKDALA